MVAAGARVDVSKQLFGTRCGWLCNVQHSDKQRPVVLCFKDRQHHSRTDLPAKGGTTEQKRQLESSFDYYRSSSINLRFSSKLNNFLNQGIAGYRF